jgi:hypothetical protein
VHYLWSEDEDGYGYIIMITVITLPLMLTWVNVLRVYAYSSLSRSQLFTTILTGQSCWALVAQALPC